MDHLTGVRPNPPGRREQSQQKRRNTLRDFQSESVSRRKFPAQKSKVRSVGMVDKGTIGLTQ